MALCRAHLLPILAALLLSGCGGIAWNTTVADRADVRLQMLLSVTPGVTTETAFVTRWGPPLQKVHEGARTEYIYRNRLGDSTRFVIVTFEHGLALGARSNETELCRGTFAPQPPGYGFDRPDTVHPVGNCGGFGGAGLPADGYNSRPATPGTFK